MTDGHSRASLKHGTTLKGFWQAWPVWDRERGEVIKATNVSALTRGLVAARIHVQEVSEIVLVNGARMALRLCDVRWREPLAIGESSDLARARDLLESRLTTLQHKVDQAGGRTPVEQAFHFTAEWPEERYLRENPDVRVAVTAAQFISGLEHFVRFGQFEDRPFDPTE